MNFYMLTADYTDSKFTEKAKATMQRVMQPNKKQKVEVRPNVSASFREDMRPVKSQFYKNESMMTNQSTVTATNRIFLTEKRHIIVQRWNSQVFACLREFYKTEDGGNFKPSRKGINLAIMQWRELIKLCRR
ncbi:uncharacterized protein LOC117111988 [Anneissia japonica]|uniref:uncharacterized protein LOC117111988 n=1 Tax=Anneissia japonica TaxID=1529436 RepID=UPI001425B1DE|nr:uncharacterized protein LOC117111988 [Anneissia japonica]